MLAEPYQVDVNSEVYTVVDAETSVYWAVIAGTATDEIFATLDAPGFAVQLERTDLASKALVNGLYCVSGYPVRSFPQLATTGYTVNSVLSAPGYRDLPVTVPIPVNASFPVSAPATAMRLLPVRIQGRVVSDATRSPIGGASIISIDDPSAPPSIHTTALRSPLYFAHANGAAVQQVAIAATGSALLSQDAASGSQVLNLSTRSGLAAGSIVSLTYASGVQLEYGVVASLGPGPASAAGQVNLTNALNRSYPAAGTTVAFVTATPTGGAATLSTDADAGDGVLLASQLFSQTVGAELGGPLAEIHAVGALSGSDGYYGLDGMGRVQEIFLQAAQGASQEIVDWFIEFDQPFNQVDFRL
jgi:hypothetical protein